MKSQVVAIGLILSVGIHAAAFTLVPSFRIGTLEGTAPEVEAVELPPEVRVPPPPAAIARPATPRVSAAPDVSEELTIAPTTFEADPVSSLGPPPRARPDSAAAERFAFVRYEVAPRLENASDIRNLLRDRYPPELRAAEIEGTVILWIFLNDRGRPERVEIRQGTPYAALNRVAREVAMEMRFTPARDRDRPVAVWVAQSMHFVVERARRSEGERAAAPRADAPATTGMDPWRAGV